MFRRSHSDDPWPIILVDTTLRTVSSDVERVPGAGALVVYWANDVPCGREVFGPADTLPSKDDLLLRGSSLGVPEPAANGGAHVATDVSLIIPTRGRPDMLRRCLSELAGQDAMPGEVIVVDNDSGPGRGHDLVREFPFATYVHEGRPGIDHARNAGLAIARKPLLAFCDDDVVLHHAWCARLAAAFDDPEVAVVTGLVLPLELRTAAQRVFEFEWGFGRGFAKLDFRHGRSGQPDAALTPWEVGAGASMAFRREIFDRLGRFDTRLGAGAAGCSDDSEMWYRVLMEGGLCRYVPEVVSFHQHRASMEELRHQIRAYMRGHVMALLVQYQRYHEPANLRRALFDLPLMYGGRTVRRMLGRQPRRRGTLTAEITGSIEGFAYFLRHRQEEPAAELLQQAAPT